MFCGKAPCECNAKPKAEPKKRAPRKKATVTPIVPTLDKRTNSSAPSSPDKKAGLTAAMRAAATSAHQGAEAVKAQALLSEEDALATDPEWVAAIKAVESLMHPTEKRRFAGILTTVVDVKSRAGLWKARVKS